VAALGGRPIGTAKLTLLRPGEVWFEGLRVDREFRGIGLAHTLTEFLLKKAARMNASSVRYATGGSNLTSQHIGKTWGFTLLRRYTCMEAPPDGRRKAMLVRVTDPVKALQLVAVAADGLLGPEAEERVGAAAAGRPGAAGTSAAAGGKSGADPTTAVTRLTRVLKSSRFVTSMKGLASEGWTFYQIDKDFVARALKRRELYVALPGGAEPARRFATRHVGAAALPGTAPETPSGPAAAGLVVASAQRRRGRLLVWTLADLREDCLPLLMGAARRLAFDLDLKEVRLVVPYARAMTIPARSVGFHREYEGMSSVVLEQVWGHGRRERHGQSGRRKTARKAVKRRAAERRRKP
jgi:GNAT superfamily N-acetyltransferase